MNISYAVKKITKFILIRALSNIPTQISYRLAQLFRESQGLGWDSGLSNEMRALAAFAKDRNISMDLVFDIGANIGDWSIAFHSHFPKSRIVAFEPSVQTFEKLSSNLAGIESANLVNMACSDFVGTHELFSPDALSGMASLAQRDLRHLNLSFSRSETIQVTTVDAYCRANQDLSPSLMKIDVEGFELSVLKGAISALATSVDLVQLEFGGTDIDSRTFFHDFWVFFEDKPFDLYRLTPKGFRKVENYDEKLEYFSFTTYLAVKT